MSSQDTSEGNVGFKEWALVCDALRSGVTSLILRKGGIAEGREGFDFGHQSFWLFPTFFHNQAEGLKPAYRGNSDAAPLPIEDERKSVVIETRVEIVETVLLTNWDAIERLSPFHVWEESVIRERFDYKGAGIKVALVRAFRLPSPFEFPYAKGKYGGCRSWVNLPGDFSVLRQQVTPVLSDFDHDTRTEEIRSLLNTF